MGGWLGLKSVGWGEEGKLFKGEKKEVGWGYGLKGGQK